MTAAISADLGALAGEIERRQRAHRVADVRPWRPQYTPVTSLVYECARRSAYHRLRPDDAAPIGEELASIFAEGRYHHEQVRRELSALGFEVLETERNLRDDKLEISGTIDGKLAIPDPNGGRLRRVPLEILSYQGRAPKSQDEWRGSTTGTLRRKYGQLQVYLYLHEEPEGILLVKDKGLGLWTLCPVALDYEEAERLIRRAEIVRDAVRAYRAADWRAEDKSLEDQVLPVRLADRSECPRCPWQHVCLPGDAPVDPALLALDPEIAAQLDRREATRAAAGEHQRLDADIKARFRLTAGTRFVVGAGRYVVEKSTRRDGAVLIKIRKTDAKEEPDGT